MAIRRIPASEIQAAFHAEIQSKSEGGSDSLATVVVGVIARLGVADAAEVAQSLIWAMADAEPSAYFATRGIAAGPDVTDVTVHYDKVGPA